MYVMEDCDLLKKEEILAFEIIWMNLEIIMLNERYRKKIIACFIYM